MVQGRRILFLTVRAVNLAARQCSEMHRLGGGARLPGVVAPRASSQLWVSPNCMVQAARMSCCAKVELPPPTEGSERRVWMMDFSLPCGYTSKREHMVTVEYHDKPEMTDYFIELADGIENAHPDIMVFGNPEGTEPRDGAFEVTTGQHVLFSKLKENRLPKLEDILLAIDQRPTEALSCELENGEKAANS